MLKVGSLLLAVLLTACALVGGQGEKSPPRASLDGVAGMAASYCWGTRCVDGFPTPSAPLVHGPKALGFDRRAIEVEVFVRTGATGDFQQRSVPVSDGQLGTLPAGDWDYLLAMVRFDAGSAMYVWRLH
jgi:hypothetical protein